MLTTKNKNITREDSIRSNFLNNTFFSSKNNINKNKKEYKNQPYKEYLNQNSLMNNHHIYSGEFTLSTTGRTRNYKEETNSNEFTLEKNCSQPNFFIKPQKDKDKFFLTNLIFHKIELKQYRDYIYYIQKKYNEKCGNYIKYIIKNKEENYNNNKFKKEIEYLENLIARYSIIIFYLVKQKQINIAKNLLLLMIKENLIYINFFEKNIFKVYSNIDDNNINLILHSIPKDIITLIKIYSFILKYSLLFNLAKNRNIFFSRYLSLQSLNYKIFYIKNETRDSYIEIKNGIKYIYSNCLFNSCYYSIMFYTSMIIPIKLSELIFKLYEGTNELIFNKKEKSLLLKTSFNYALFLYLNGNNESAIGQLELIKQKLISFYDGEVMSDDDDDDEDEEKEKEDSLIDDPFKKFRKKKEQKKLSISLKDKILIKSKETLKKFERRRGFSRAQTTIDKIKEILFNIRIDDEPNFNSKKLFEPFEQVQLNKIEHKKTIKIEEIKKFFISDVKSILNRNENRKCSITENDLKNQEKIQNNFGVKKTIKSNRSESIVNLRASHINFSSMLIMNKSRIPKYMTNNILIETELLMCEIEIDSKNINEAYEHFKNSILILFISKQSKDKNDIKSILEFRKKLNKISIYLKEINKYIDENNKKEKEKFKIIKSLIKNNKTFIIKNKKKIFKKKKFITKNSSMEFEINNLESENEEEEDNNNNNNEKNNKNNKIINYNEYYNELINKKLSEEIEKFFIFLNTLSAYQLKLLNDTQPKREIRNDLPILFNNQFKDSLTSGQRDTLRYLHTMSISRNMMLNNPDKLILPNNLKFSVLINNNNNNNYIKKDKDKNKDINKEIKIIKNIKNHKIYNKVISLTNSIEYSYFKNIIFSQNINKNLQKFFLENYSLVMKILKESKQNEINDIINNPNILIEPINNYKKNKSKKLNNNWIKNNISEFKEIKDLKKLLSKLNNLTFDPNINEKKNNDILIDNDSDNNKSFNLSINNSSLYN